MRITPAGVVTPFLDADPEVGRVSVGEDGNLWIASGASFKVVTTGGVLLGVHSDPDIRGVGGVASGPDGALWFTNQNSNSIGRIVVLPEPDPPVAVAAVPGDGAALVSWAPGAGSVPAAGYTVTASPGGATCSWTSGPTACTVTGLENGTPHTFVVTATSAAGGSAQSAPSAVVTPQAAAPGAGFHPLAPVRLLDSRTGTGGWSAPVAAGTPRSLNVTGNHGVAADATAVVLNVTATGSSANSFLTVFPAGQSPPNVSNLNFGVGQTVPNLVTVKVGANGQVGFATNAGATHVVADLVGWYGPGPGEGYNPVAPARILDSRGSTGGWGGAPLGATPKTLLVRGAGGVPASADAVVMNVTVTQGSANSFLTAYPSGQPRPTASNLNFAVGQTVPNLVSVKLGADGRVAFANNAGTAHVIADVVGYYDPASGGRFHPLDPARVFDSRGGSGKVAAGAPRTVPLVGAGGIPAGASAVVGNVTVTEGTENSFLTVHPADLPLPGTSTLNFAVGQTVPNLAVLAPGTTGRIAVANAAGAMHVIIDAMGYFAAT